MRKKIVLAGAFICLFFLHAPTVKADQWNQQSPEGSQNWTGVTSSADGTQLAAVTNGGDIYTSTTSGDTWTDQTGSGAQSWSSITSSSDGTHLAATVNGGDIFTSTDSGVTWTDQTGSGAQSWSSITSSSDGTHLAATVNGGDIFTSTDSGVTWTDQTAAGSRSWTSITSSSDGTHLAATDNSGSAGDIYTSTDSGATWTDQTAAGSQNWVGITSSSDGTHLAAVVSAPGGYPSPSGNVYTSTDGGATWTQRSVAPIYYSGWSSITSSSNGMILAAASYGNYNSGSIFVSTDGGATWKLQALQNSYTSIASSADGLYHVAVEGGQYSSGYIVTGIPPTRVVTLTRGFSLDHATSTTAYGIVLTQLVAGFRYAGNDPSLTEGFVYGLTTAYGATTTVSSIDNDDGQYFSKVIPNLACGTTYHYQAFAINDLGLGYGGDQTLTTNSCTPSPYQWTIQTGTGTANYWTGIASSADGTKLAVSSGGGDIFTSTDSGVTWTDQTAAGSEYWGGISSSADGTKLAAVDQFGDIYISTDSGVMWTNQSPDGSQFSQDIAMSSDGTHIAACLYDGSMIISTDGGVTWSVQTVAGAEGNCNDIVYSGDGTHLFAIYDRDSSNDGYGDIYISSDYGMSWTMDTAAGARGWVSIASSADGSHLVATASVLNNYAQFGNDYGVEYDSSFDRSDIFTSSDGGNTWVARPQAGIGNWSGTASSADGMDLAVADGGPGGSTSGDIYVSRDGGVTWSNDPAAGTRTWSRIVSSTDGTKLAGIVIYWPDSTQDGQIYTAQTSGSGGSSSTTPTLSTSAASSLTDTAATLNGALTSTGGIAPTIEGFVYGLTTSYGATTTTSGSFSTGSFSATVGSLVCNTTYHFASYATNSVGTGYGSDQTFMTSSCPSSGGGGGGSNSSGSSGSSSNTAAVPGYNTVPLAQANYFLKTQQYKQLVELVYQYPQTFEDYVTNGYTIDPQILMIINSLYKPGTYLENSTTHSVPTTYTFTRNLTVGDRGPDVKALQQLLIQLNTGPAAQALALNGPTNYFGKLTQAALAEYQKVNGVVPFVGYFGPKTRAVL